MPYYGPRAQCGLCTELVPVPELKQDYPQAPKLCRDCRKAIDKAMADFSTELEIDLKNLGAYHKWCREYDDSKDE
jgi:hypothetical protein